ncbi:aspartyl/asparaginyl beta-hydroxylase domain-containing protein [Oceanospirillum beijerinckii]|uniref:aspartyl/asparaginyl beta-hydroxylase domain-containing protein n=1 Tax=Oceanospirillum beijerinckii TaxID=64976 RepID=UPI0012FF0C90|nr:aspartyl/asparaginyl beta-hydroxylase domain-containing protein [Oceanospirillum beijerinckii]
MKEQDDLQGWYPIDLLAGDQPQVVWVNLQGRPLSQPFFFDDLRRVPKASYRTLPLDSLTERGYSTSLYPSAFIFHVSRCGSTLMTQQLMQSARCHVLSEPPILEAVLSYGRKLSSASERQKLLYCAITALGQSLTPRQTHCIIKLDCWHLADLPLIQQVFPDVPCFLLYREPEKIFASHQKQPGVQMVPGLVDTGALPMDTSAIPIADLAGYQLEVLHGLFTSALEQAEHEPVALKLINYHQLPDITTQAFAQAIALDLTEQELAAMQQRSRKHSKHHTNDFKQETEKAFTSCYQARLESLAAQYQQLETIRSQRQWSVSSDCPFQDKEFVMTDAYHKLPMTFDVIRLQQDLACLQDNQWLEHINTGVHDGGWTALPLRAVDGEVGNAAVVEMDPERYQSTPYLEQSDYLREVLASFDCTLVSARLMSLKAGQEIRRHTDMDLCFEDGCVRLHIPVQTHPDVIFLINDQPIHFGEGECWYMNANYPHQVTNNSVIDRVHLVIDCLVNAWLENMFVCSGYKKTETVCKYGDPSITDHNVLQVIEHLEALGADVAFEMAKKLRSIWLNSQKSA